MSYGILEVGPSEIEVAAIDLVSSWRYSNTEYLSIIEQRPHVGYWLDELKSMYEQPESFILAYKQEKKIVGLLAFESTPWESELFKKKMGSIRYLMIDAEFVDANKVAARLIEECVSLAKTKKFDFIATKCSSADIKSCQAFSMNDFVLTDSSLDYVVDFKRTYAADLDLNKNVLISEGVEADRNEVVSLFELCFAGHFGRFNNDQNLKPFAQGAYKQWVCSSFDGYADLIFLAKVNNKIVGATFWKYPSAAEKKYKLNLGHYSIGAVHPDYSGLKIFRNITVAGTNRMREMGLSAIEGPTSINNFPVQSAYSKLGWNIMGARHIFHLWI